MRLLTKTEKRKCDKCKSSQVIKMRKMQTAKGLKQKWFCKDCYHFFIKKG